MQTITRADLADAVAREIDQPRQDSAALVETVLELTASVLEQGETVKLSTFGAFSVRDKGERVGRNPKTNTEVPIAPRRVVSFRPSHVLKERIDTALSPKN